MPTRVGEVLSIRSTGRAGSCLLARGRQRGATVTSNVRPHMHELIRTWRQLDTRHRPYVLPGDDRVLRDTDCFRCASWAAYCANPNFGAVESGHFHVDLLPVPFAGRLDRASVFVLLLNPGFGPHDYFAESKVRAFREMRIANLRQSAAARFDYLSPDFSWHGGFRYWHGRLSRPSSPSSLRRTASPMEPHVNSCSRDSRRSS